MLLAGNMSKLSQWIDAVRDSRLADSASGGYNYNKRYDLYRHVVRSEKLEGIYYLEFGVSQGYSFDWWVRNIHEKNSRFVGFDTFTGLPEKWGVFQKGDMSASGRVPKTDDERCRFIKGLFQDTLPEFLKTFDSTLRKVIHLDADIYTSTLFVLTMMAPRLRKGDILIFDEFTVPLHEFRAYTDFVSSYYIKTEVIGSVNNFFQTAFKIV